VSFGFYGNSDQYLSVRRAKIDRYTEIARSLAYENDPDPERVPKSFDEELADYLDRTSSLVIKNAVAGDGRFEAHCELIQSPGDLGKVAVTVKYSRGWLSSKQQASSIQKAFVSPGVVRITPVAPGGRKWSDVHVDVEVSRRNGGKHSENESFGFGKL